MQMMTATIKHRMTEVGEKVLRQLFNERVKIHDYAEIKMKRKHLVAADAEELFWVWLEYIKSIGINEDK